MPPCGRCDNCNAGSRPTELSLEVPRCFWPLSSAAALICAAWADALATRISEEDRWGWLARRLVQEELNQ